MISLLRAWIKAYLPASIQAKFGKVWPSLVYGSEACSQKRFSVYTYLTLRASGWFPGRCINTKVGVAIQHEPATRIFSEFGDLRIPDQISSKKADTHVVIVQTLREAQEDHNTENCKRMISNGFYRIGCLDDVSSIWVNSSGKIYIGDFRYGTEEIADSFDEALEKWLVPRARRRATGLVGK